MSARSILQCSTYSETVSSAPTKQLARRGEDKSPVAVWKLHLERLVAGKKEDQ